MAEEEIVKELRIITMSAKEASAIISELAQQLSHNCIGCNGLGIYDKGHMTNRMLFAVDWTMK